MILRWMKLTSGNVLLWSNTKIFRVSEIPSVRALVYSSQLTFFLDPRFPIYSTTFDRHETASPSGEPRSLNAQPMHYIYPREHPSRRVKRVSMQRAQRAGRIGHVYRIAAGLVCRQYDNCAYDGALSVIGKYRCIFARKSGMSIGATGSRPEPMTGPWLAQPCANVCYKCPHAVIMHVKV